MGYFSASNDANAWARRTIWTRGPVWTRRKFRTGTSSLCASTGPRNGRNRRRSPTASTSSYIARTLAQYQRKTSLLQKTRKERQVQGQAEANPPNRRIRSTSTGQSRQKRVSNSERPSTKTSSTSTRIPYARSKCSSISRCADLLGTKYSSWREDQYGRPDHSE